MDSLLTFRGALCRNLEPMVTTERMGHILDDVLVICAEAFNVDYVAQMVMFSKSLNFSFYFLPDIVKTTLSYSASVYLSK
jgi:hypothetical protein